MPLFVAIYALSSLLADSGVDPALGQALSLALVVAFLVVAPIAVEFASRGRSLGKLAIGARIVRDDGGAIVMVSSVSATRPSPGTAGYGAAKAGLDSLTSSLAVEWAPKVRVNGLQVGMVRTENAELHYGDTDSIAAVERTVPLQRLAEPGEIGNCAAFLASTAASYVSGATLLVHGGGEVPAFLAASDANKGSS